MAAKNEHLPRSVVFLNRFYWPDVAATGQMLTDLAEDLASRGWRVTVVTSSGTYDADDVELPAEASRNGVHILRVKGTAFGRHWLPGRLLDYATFLARAALALLRVDKPWCYVALSDPPFAIALVLAAARLRGSYAVYWVQDLFPQIAAALEVMSRRGILYRTVRRISVWLNARCDAIIALGPQMQRALIESGARSDRSTFTHNWADASSIRPVPPGENAFLRDDDELTGKFIVLYSGNAGRAHPFEAVLHAAKSLRDDTEVLFLFIGGGQRIPFLKADVAALGLQNVRFRDYQPRESLAASLSSASVSIVTEEPSVVGLLVPSKTYGILASGRPLIFIGSTESDVAQIVRQAECGILVAPGDGHGLLRAIETLRSDPILRTQLGENARMAAEQRYDRKLATRNWENAVTGLLSGCSPMTSQLSS